MNKKYFFVEESTLNLNISVMNHSFIISEKTKKLISTLKHPRLEIIFWASNSKNYNT